MDPRISKVNDYVLAMIVAAMTATFSLVAYLFINFHTLSPARFIVVLATLGGFVFALVGLSLLFFYLIFKEADDE